MKHACNALATVFYHLVEARHTAAGAFYHLIEARHTPAGAFYHLIEAWRTAAGAFYHLIESTCNAFFNGTLIWSLLDCLAELTKQA
ncbi:MAG: hypothetical protein ACK5IJ_01390 [Mangrovibacterium sp.]